MRTDAEIFLSLPGSKESEKYFSIRLKQELINEPSIYLNSDKILAISDIEGNFSSLCKLLMRNGVINKRLNWTFDTGQLVIVGDCFDRGDQVMECLWLIYMLEEKSKKKGGKVHFILGNHEIMNMNGDWRYVHPRYAEKTKSSTPHTALYHGNSELWRWLRTKNVIEKIGDTLFVHAGISPDLLKFKLSVEEINIRIRPHYTQAGIQFIDPLLNVAFDASNSPFWYRGYYSSSGIEELVEETLIFYGVKTIVTGHTIVPQVTSFFNGKVINVDTDHAAGISEALLISKNRFYRVTSDKQRQRIK